MSMWSAGESHPVLKDTDFVVGFMNATMEKKLKDFGKIICMDGTHCTNRKEMDLTIMLIRSGGSRAFLGALKKKVGEELQPEYFMNDDDPKYYNAWQKEDNSVLGDVALGDQSKEIKNSHQEEIQDFIESKRTIDEGTNEVDREAIRRMGNQEIPNALNELDFETY
ncbi:hypothetical protein ILUMI_14262 [Ignelater luminosus]|uniref:Uncharacterized protein n=1 Tax=Ignelater luminosus TaxID=2038154 RepID=A0A8K0CV73_IGNLU|nr:hypothetical protein ILUMI_14262 [Ignelater luminosus]